ncbi:hypothetical protein [Haloarchaeobius sp. TZWSO28]|uniref:hypothetical protein n=1 Tax=unclassified Haloarchaeobius TaxID=2614452 RepID=UPI003EC0D7E0
MSLTDEFEKHGLGPTLVALTLAIGSANRGLQELFGVDAVTTIFGSQYGSLLMTAVGIVGLVKLAELLTDLSVLPEVVSDERR